MAQKTTFSIEYSANRKGGVSRDLLECLGSGIRFITILPISMHHMTGLTVKDNAALPAPIETPA